MLDFIDEVWWASELRLLRGRSHLLAIINFFSSISPPTPMTTLEHPAILLDGNLGQNLDPALLLGGMVEDLFAYSW